MDEQTPTPTPVTPPAGPQPEVIPPQTGAAPTPAAPAPAAPEPTVSPPTMPATPASPSAAGGGPEVYTAPGAETMTAKKPKKLMLIVAIVVVVLLIAGGAYFFLNKKNSKTSGTSAASSSGTVSAANTAAAEDSAKAFIVYNQTGEKAQTDAMLTTELKAQLKQQTGADSYFDLCKAVATCAQYKWIDLKTTPVSTADYTSKAGVKGKTVTFSVVTKTANTSSTNTLTLSFIVENGKYLIDDIGGQTNVSGSTN